MVNGRAIFCLGSLEGFGSIMDAIALREKLLSVVEPLVEEEGFELNDLQVTGGQHRPTVRVLIDLDEPDGPDKKGVRVEDCVHVSRYLSPTLDADGVIPGAFVLEVSSAGVERALRTERHFRRVVGKDIKMVAESVDFVQGTLHAVQDGPPVTLVIVSGEREWIVPLADVRRAHLSVTPDELFGRQVKGGARSPGHGRKSEVGSNE
jgi:ribosome maturation factor RimP